MALRQKTRVVITESWDWGFCFLERHPGRDRYISHGDQKEKRKIRQPSQSSKLEKNHNENRKFWNSRKTEISNVNFNCTGSQACKEGLGKWKREVKTRQHGKPECGQRKRSQLNSDSGTRTVEIGTKRLQFWLWTQCTVWFSQDWIPKSSLPRKEKKWIIWSLLGL